MSRESPGNRTFFSASSTCSGVGIGSLFLLFESLERGADDRNRFLGGADDRNDIEILRTDQTLLHHGAVDPFDQAGPHCTDQDQRMLRHVLDLQKLPDHEELQSRSDSAGHHDEGRRQPHEVMQTRKERAMAKDLVDERIGLLFGRQVNRQTKGASMALDLAFGCSGIRGFHQTGTAAGDDVDAHPRQLVAQRLDLFVDRIAVADAGAAEDRDTVVLDALGLDLIEVVDGIPQLVNRLIEYVRRVCAGTLLGLSLAQLLQLGSGAVFPLTRHVPPSREGQTCYRVIQTSLENSLSFGSAARASVSVGNLTRTRKVGPLSLVVRST